MAQIFHISGGAGRMFGVWAIGAAAVAYAVRSIPNATVAIVLSFLFVMGYGGFWWYGPDHQLCWYPTAVIVVLVPLVYLCNSRWLLWLMIINLTITSLAVFADHVEFLGVYSISVSLGAAFLGWGILNNNTQSFRHFSHHCMNAGAVLILFFIFLVSFGEIAVEIQGNLGNLFRGDVIVSGILCAYILLSFVLFGVLVFRHFKSISDPLTVLLLGIGGLVLGLVGMVSPEVVPMIIANVLLVAIAASIIRASFSEEDRRKFWCGAVILGAVIIGRTLEFETGLLIKAMAFTGSGIGVIVGGVFFEKFMRKRKVLHA